MNKEWLAGLSVGDEVLVHNSMYRSIRKVSRITPTQIVVGLTKFRRHSGSQVGGSVWNGLQIRQVTDADREAAERAKIVAAVSAVLTDNNSPISLLRAISACLKDQP